ncbi:exopolysaccharide biosynthesis polyprenyl glycosylphosphotransferase [Curtanaerobium respiraculi]|uniref:exopolysaccharide biosynthesis polyprenyl glycosylphosphotransferase n=1 Tax=Curtanaerobium respiraculi TaxID=2949669 RepID=UPI0024B33366|nr:exopolysaccharide biosynthesis polyprenyl glycosylphosphotransferase [Curtanaerobium respiraculi]
MSRKKRHIVYAFLALFDAAIIVASYLISSRLYVGSLKTLAGLDYLHLPLRYNSGMIVLVVYACILVAFYAATRMYGSIWLGRTRDMAKRVLMVNTVGIVVFAAALYVLHMDDVSRMTLFIFYLTSTALVVFKGWITIQVFYRMRKSGKGMRPVLVVGCGNLAQHYANVIGRYSARLEHVVGYVVPTMALASEQEVARDCPLLRERLGFANELDRILETHSVEEIIVALEYDEYDNIRFVVAAADKYGTALTLVPFYSDIIPRRPDIDSVEDVKLVDMRSIPLAKPLSAFVKRTLDIVVSIVVIILTSWIMLLAAIGVKASSPGPALFRQERTGRRRKPFKMLKFRSMRLTDKPVSTFKEDKDARKTRFGSFIRKYSIDELPQFFNVLVGQMSIVGPRPVVERETLAYRDRISRYMLRHQVRPGITGWAQINGLRGDPSIEKAIERTEYDLWYIEHWSVLLDVKIFFRTLFGGFINSEKLI